MRAYFRLLSSFVIINKMAYLFTLALILFTGAACSERQISDRIVGGDPTTIDKYPSLVQLDAWIAYLQAWSHDCGGSILNSAYILSAAHCFTNDGPESRRIRAGATYRNIGGAVHYISAIHNHPSYGSNGNDGDISVIRLSTFLVFSSVVQPVTIIRQGDDIPDNQPVVHAGWGLVESGGQHSEVLQDVTVYTVNREVCNQRYNGIITQNMICTGILDVGGKDACQSDSGGPLYYNNILVGVISFGAGCADAYWPGVNARVSSYTDWIVATAV